jgi:phosphopantetheinyl transferase
MYVLFDFKLPHFQFALLKSDSFDNEAAVLFEQEIEHLNKRINPKRKNEFLGVRYLRKELNINSPILYHDSGKPYFSQADQALSISHTKDYIALAIAKFLIGIDIEQKDRDATKIINKFAREDEKNLCADKDWHLQLWCAKEAIYKLVGLENLSFKNDIRITFWQKKKETTCLSATVQQANQRHEIEVQLHTTNELHIAIAFFKAAP